MLGQADFTSGAGNRGATAAANTLSGPTYVWSDGTRLVVTDAFNHRTLIWNTFPTTNGQAADLLVGQPDMTTATPGTDASTLHTPAGVCSNGTQLFVGDFGTTGCWSGIRSPR